MSEPREHGVRGAPDYRPHHREPFVVVATPPLSPEQLTWVELVFDPGRTERWIRFGHGVDQRIVSRRNRFVACAGNRTRKRRTWPRGNRSSPGRTRTDPSGTSTMTTPSRDWRGSWKRGCDGSPDRPRSIPMTASPCEARTMKKPFLTVYLTPDLLDRLVALARRRGVPKSTVAEAAIASFLTPDAAQQQEAALGRRLDRLNRHADRLERDLEVAVEMLALFIRTWMAATPALPDAAQATARVRGQERYERFIENLGRRLASGRSFTREIALELEGLSSGEAAPRGPVRTSGADDAPAFDPASGPPSDRPE